MDKVKAAELTNKLVGNDVDGWTIEKYINCGKSAAVFEASKEGQNAAIKIFDDELIEKYGDDTQIGRIERERSLVGQDHPNLVKIFDGGLDEKTNYYFIAMEYLRGPNIAQALKDIPYDRIPILLNQLASAAQFLEDLEICHRDIKPENIVVLDDFQKLVLLDLGVLRPFGDGSLTDDGGVQEFVGTLQYSSPEFLLRQEEDSTEGWRALTFYQIGGVLHDLITKKPLFEEYKIPYARLVNAVQNESPAIANELVSQKLKSLAARCLLKDWRKRLELVNWSDFEKQETVEETSSAQQRVLNRIRDSREISEDIDESQNKSDEVDKELLRETTEFIKASVSSIRASSSALPRGQVFVNRTADPECQIFITFDAFERGLVFDSVNCILSVVLEDIAAKIITITACAARGTRPSKFNSDVADQIFQGPYDGDAIFSSLESYIFELIDAVQNRSAVENSETEWLHIRGVNSG